MAFIERGTHGRFGKVRVQGNQGRDTTVDPYVLEVLGETGNQTFAVDGGTASGNLGAGVVIIPQLAGTAPKIATLSTGTNEGLLIDAKGTGTITLGSISTGGVLLNKIGTVAASGATATLTAAQSGSVVLVSGTHCAITLPAPAVGLNYTFILLSTPSGGNHSVVTDAGTTFIQGIVQLVIDNSATTKAFLANGTSHTTLTLNGTTTGGILGTQFQYTCVSATKWNVTGLLNASGVLATPIS